MGSDTRVDEKLDTIEDLKLFGFTSPSVRSINFLWKRNLCLFKSDTWSRIEMSDGGHVTLVGEGVTHDYVRTLT